MDIQTKEDLEQYFYKLTDPLKKYRIKENGRLKLGTSVAHYTQDQGEIEGFLRTLWAIGPMAGNHNYNLEDFKYYIDAIVHSTNPKDVAYWGEVHDYDQLIVEMAALSVTLIETKDIFWDQLEKVEQENLYQWLNQINQVGVHANNWRFFRILTNVAFIKLEQPYDQEQLAEDLKVIEGFYLKNGWYQDGNPRQMDYYIPWAFHYYGLLYAHYMKTEDPETSQKFIERAKLFAQDFKYWFSKNNGAAIPYGRSLTYRFAEVGFWAVAVFTNVEVLPWGEIKGILLKNFSYWSTLPIQKRDGVLSIGYGFENFYMAEGYNSPGSPYWGYKAFILLATNPNHPFWKATAVFPKVAAKKKLTVSYLMTNEDGNNAQMFPTNQWTKQLHAADKYSKFVYSSLFGFSVLKGNLDLKEGAFDNTLAVSEKGCRHYISKEEDITAEVTENYTCQTWQPFPDVTITSYVIPFGNWHVRLHKIENGRPLDVADGGFSNQTQNIHPQDYAFEPLANGYTYTSKEGTTASLFLAGYSKVEATFPEVNTNLLFPHAMHFTALGTLEKGTHLLVSGHYGSLNTVTDLPQFVEEKEKYVISCGHEVVEIKK